MLSGWKPPWWPRVLEQLAFHLRPNHSSQQLEQVRQTTLFTSLSDTYAEPRSFVGGGQFCFKACDNSIKNPDYCQNIYDTKGCAWNMPAAYAPGVFLSCAGDNQEAPNASSAAPLPATSDCTTYTSSQLYSDVSTFFLF